MLYLKYGVLKLEHKEVHYIFIRCILILGPDFYFLWKQ